MIRQNAAILDEAARCTACHSPATFVKINGAIRDAKQVDPEWKNSRFAEQGIQCQDCHMSELGRLVGGTPLFESGRAAHMTMGAAPVRERPFSHRFPGMHSARQLAGAVTLTIGTDRPSCSPGEEVVINVAVANSGAGHKLPTGSADLRQMWLTVDAQVGGRVVPIAATPAAGSDAFDVAGKGKFDSEILGADIPRGSRVYRSVFLDVRNQQALRSYEATRIVFDNRLETSETRKETYPFVVPATASGKIVLRARVNYLSYPSSFAARLGLPPPKHVEVASTSRVVTIR